MSIQKLSEGLISHLASGEVVDRPSSVIRECIDNSIDASSTFIKIVTENSGTTTLSIIDNGKGIAKEDLSKIASAHSTSKIKTLDDIYNIKTLGFRGEALFSMRAVSDLFIESNGWGVDFIDEEKKEIYKSIIENGTKITVNSLFKRVPVRALFLKSENAEHLKNKALIIEKSLPFNNIEFIYINNNKEILHYNVESEIERVKRFLSDPLSLNSVNNNIETNTYKDKDFSLTIYYNLSLLRKDKSKIKIYVNSRAVTDNYLQSSLLYAFSSFIPGGLYPSAVLFINNDSTLTDFNVHPQKKEVRLRNASSIHSAISHSLIIQKNTEVSLADSFIKNTKESFNKQPFFNKVYSDIEDKSISKECEFLKNINLENTTNNNFKSEYSFNNEIKAKNISSPLKEKTENIQLFTDIDNSINFSYLGQIWNMFLLYTIENTLYIIDQHAAAERLLFEKIKKNDDIQHLLFPITFDVDKTTSETIFKNIDLFKKNGITLEKKDDDKWILLSYPSVCKNSENEIIKLIQNSKESELEASLYSTIACHNSIRAGEKLKDEDAISLIKDVIKNNISTCPHGRAFITSITKSELCQKVLRDF